MMTERERERKSNFLRHDLNLRALLSMLRRTYEIIPHHSIWIKLKSLKDLQIFEISPKCWNFAYSNFTTPAHQIHIHINIYNPNDKHSIIVDRFSSIAANCNFDIFRKSRTHKVSIANSRSFCDNKCRKRQSDSFVIFSIFFILQNLNR